MKESRYNNEDLLVRLRAIFGRVDQIRDCIDRALQQDNAHCRKRDMRFLLLPTRFPERYGTRGYHSLDKLDM